MITIVDDPTFEDEVRAMLARRAADIPLPATGDVPPLPTGLRVSLDDPRPDRRRPVPLVAAVVVLLLGAVGVVAVARGDGDRERTGSADAPTRPIGAVPDIPGLPQGLGTGDLLPLWTDPPGGDRDPKTDGGLSNGPLALHRYLQDRFPDGMGSGSRSGEIEGFPDWYRTTFTLRAGEDGGEADEGTAYLWWSGEAWSVMAVLSSVHDLSQLVVDRERVTGSIHGDGPPRVAAIGLVEDRRLDSWPVGTATFSLSSGGDVPIVVDEALPDGPTSLIVAPQVVTTDPPPSFSELAFDPTELAEPGPTTVPTIPGDGVEDPSTSVVGIPVDAPLGVAVQSALPAGEDLVAAQHRSNDVRLDIVELSSVVDGSGYTVSLYRAFDPAEYGSDGTPVPFGRAWYGGSTGSTSLTVQSDTGVALNVFHEDPEQAVSHGFLLALAETLVNDPVVAAVARGADPAG